MTITYGLIALLVLFGIWFIIMLALAVKRAGWPAPTWVDYLIGFVTNFFDTWGIGSFAPTTAAFKLLKIVPDQRIPGTLNVGDVLPTIVEALIFMSIVAVSPVTLLLLILSAIAGAWLGAGVVSKWPRRYVQVGMGCALLAAAILFTLKDLNIGPAGGKALELQGTLLIIGIVGNFVLGALMTLGIGLYAPCLIMISLLGMNPLAAFPIMMGSCAFLMPVASVRFMKFNAYDLRAAIGLTIAGIPGVLAAAYIIHKLPLQIIMWVVVVVVLYTAIMMLRSAWLERNEPQMPPQGLMVAE